MTRRRWITFLYHPVYNVCVWTHGVQKDSTALHVACQGRQERVALLLIDFKCVTDLEDVVCMTYMLVIFIIGYLHCIRFKHCTVFQLDIIRLLQLAHLSL